MTDQNHCISSSPFSVWVYSSLIFDSSLNSQGIPRWWGMPDSQIRDLKQKPTFSYPIFSGKKKSGLTTELNMWKTKLSKPYFLAALIPRQWECTFKSLDAGLEVKTPCGLVSTHPATPCCIHSLKSDREKLWFARTLGNVYETVT